MPPLIVSYGAGINSSAMLVGMAERGLRPDAILFADTGAEHPHTYAFVSAMSTWCEAKGFPPVTVLRHQYVRADGYTTLEAECLGSGTLPSKAYGFSKCAQKWKVQPQLKWGKTWKPAVDCWAAGGLVSKAIGFHLDESRRVKPDNDPGYRKIYPMIEWGWRQEDCVDAVQRAGLPKAGKSACFFCPSTTRNQVRRLSVDYPELLARAIAIEDNARAAGNLQTVKGLGRAWTWRALAEATAAQCDLFAEADDSLPCGCHDGEADDD